MLEFKSKTQTLEKKILAVNSVLLECYDFLQCVHKTYFELYIVCRERLRREFSECNLLWPRREKITRSSFRFSVRTFI